MARKRTTKKRTAHGSRGAHTRRRMNPQIPASEGERERGGLRKSEEEMSGDEPVLS